MVHGKRSEREVEGSVKFSLTDPITYSVPSIAKLTCLFLKFTAYQFKKDTLQPDLLYWPSDPQRFYICSANNGNK